MSQETTARWLICRICLKSENKLYNLFDPIAEEEIRDLGTLVDKIELCGAIKLNQQHNLPNKICCRCVLLLRAAYKFRDLCQQSQYQLYQFITAIPQKEDTDEIHEVNFDSDAEEQKTEVQEEASNGAFKDVDYVVEESVVAYDDSSYEAEEYTVSKKDNYMNTIEEEEEEIEIQDLIDDDNSQHVEEVDAKQLISEDNEYEISNYEYEEDYSSNIIIDEQIKTPALQIITKVINQKKPSARRKRKNSQCEGFNNGIYSCTFCDNTYTDKTKYTNHMKIHIKDKPHECEICKKCFSTTPQLSRHMNSHTGNRPYKCQYCEASFGDPSTKIKHERIHTNERPYKCCLCEKSFAYSNVLKVHMMTHTGEKPHNCEFCGKSFSQLHHKNAHEKRHTNLNNMVMVQNSPDYMEDDDLNKFQIEETV